MPRPLQFTEEYRNFIKEQWHRFQNGEDVSDMVRPLICASWQRCRKLQVPVDHIGHAPLEKREFELICQEEHKLIATAEPILKRIWERVREQKFMFSLANARGIMLRTFVGAWMPQIHPGAYVQEKNVGTAGMTECLFTGQPVVIYGAEHYCRPHHNFVCTASPIFDPEGRLLGGVNISSTIEAFHPYSVTIIQEAARSISEQLNLQHLLDIETKLIESFSEGMLVVRKDGTVTRANSRARTLLQIARLPENCTLQELFRTEELVQRIREGKEFRNEEVRLKQTDRAGVQESCVMSFTPTDTGGIISLRPAAEMHSYAARTVGSKAVYSFGDIIGQSARMRACTTMAEKVARSSLTVLLTGESGTGKELFAQSIHNASSRRDQPFIAVNCGALPRDLIQAELFGYVEGAFTGARRQGNPGKFELADKGTIFLDEIGEMSLDAQVSLLCLLQNSEVTRIGAHRAGRINVRVIAATNRNLAEAVRQKIFREDLYYRLNVFSLQIPSLRERREDIILLAQAFLRRLSQSHEQLKGHVFSSAAADWMTNYAWPGNVRQLEHAVERAAFTAAGPVIQPEDFSEYSQTAQTLSQPSSPVAASAPVAASVAAPAVTNGTVPLAAADNPDIMVLKEALQRSNGRVEQAAALLGLSRTTLYTRLNQYGIRAKDYRRLQLKN